MTLRAQSFDVSQNKRHVRRKLIREATKESSGSTVMALVHHACSSLLLLDFSVFVRSLEARLPHFHQRKSKWGSDSKRKLQKAKQHLDGYSMERTTPIVQFSYLQTSCEFLQRNLNLARCSGGFS